MSKDQRSARRLFPFLISALFAVLLAARAHAQSAAGSEPASVRYLPSSGLRIESADGNFALAPGAWLQTLYTLTREDEKSSQGLELRRARVLFAGHAFGKDNRLFLQLGLSPSDVQLSDGHVRRSPLFDAYLEFTQLRDASLRVGQYRVPFSRQRVMAFGNLALVDRAAANFEFSLDRDQGLHLFSSDLLGLGLLRYQLGAFMGEGRDARAPRDMAMLYTARVELLPLGLFDDYSEVDLERSQRPLLSLGAGYAFLERGKSNRGILGTVATDGGTTDSHHVTADALCKWRGVTLLVEAHYRNGRRHFGSATVQDELGMPAPAPREPARDGYGWFGQADSLLGTLPLDATFRYGQVRGTGSSRLADSDELGAGIAWNVGARRFRVQADYAHRYPAHHFSEGADELRVSARLGI